MSHKFQLAQKISDHKMSMTHVIQVIIYHSQCIHIKNVLDTKLTNAFLVNFCTMEYIYKKLMSRKSLQSKPHRRRIQSHYKRKQNK